MKRADALMTLALLGSLGLSALTLVLTRRHDTDRVQKGSPAQQGYVVDATGERVRLRRFSRVASSSILADAVLLSLAEPDRVVGLSEYGTSDSYLRYRYGKRMAVDPNGDLEALIALRPDLLLVNNFADRKRVERLRDAGVVVFELGEMRGLGTLLEQIGKVATLLGEPERGRTLAHDFLAQMRGVAADVLEARRKRGLYLGVHGTQLYGGATGTSYHDVLTHAGVIDVAATQYRDWPAFTSEQILALDPEVIITSSGHRELLCHNAALSQLRACAPGGQVVEVDSRLLVDPGLAMLDATIAVREAIYGPIPAPKN